MVVTARLGFWTNRVEPPLAPLAVTVSPPPSHGGGTGSSPVGSTGGSRRCTSTERRSPSAGPGSHADGILGLVSVVRRRETGVATSEKCEWHRRAVRRAEDEQWECGTLLVQAAPDCKSGSSDIGDSIPSAPTVGGSDNGVLGRLQAAAAQRPRASSSVSIVY